MRLGTSNRLQLSCLGLRMSKWPRRLFLTFAHPMTFDARSMRADGQRVLALSDASPSAILDEAKAIKLYVSAVERSKGRKVDPRSGAANKILAAAKVHG